MLVIPYGELDVCLVQYNQLLVAVKVVCTKENVVCELISSAVLQACFDHNIHTSGNKRRAAEQLRFLFALYEYWSLSSMLAMFRLQSIRGPLFASKIIDHATCIKPGLDI